MRAYIGITDGDWYEFLSRRPDLDEVNFWRPRDIRTFRGLSVGELFLFKLHSPRNSIVGGGFFSHFSVLPLHLAWSAFEERNGAATLEEMRSRVRRYQRARSGPRVDDQIGCILLAMPFFLPQTAWIDAPSDWGRQTVQGAQYDLTKGEGRRVWREIEDRVPRPEEPLPESAGDRYGEPVLIRPRLGQGSFRIVVTDIYRRRCAVTRERTLPALEAAHIRRHADGGLHHASNGLLLRSDIHHLLDTGYVTVTPDYRFQVSPQIREEFENGRDYYALERREIELPENEADRPSRELLEWHGQSVFLA